MTVSVRNTITSFIILSFLLFVLPVNAQVFSPTVGISILLKSSDQAEAKNGYIVAKDPDEYYITRSYQDPNVAGVIANETDFLYTTDNADDRITIAVDGVTDVWVSNAFGQIKYGDFITTSTDTGVGVKAIENGSVIGYALEPTQEGNDLQLISVQLELSDSWNGSEITNDKSLFKKSSDVISNLLSNAESEAQGQSRSFLYLIILVIVISASIFGFLTFGRIAVNGISAVGRNPLAKDTIVKTVVINSLITIVFTLGALIIALLIIR